MTSGQIKGSLLEYLIRRLLSNCGFTTVKTDGHYVYAQNGSGLFFINGKGAAHDADVLMDPPFQMPFSYPSRLLFECKAYGNKVGLDVIRNALGLRYDINEFEIVTDDSIQKRKNNNRSSYAISDRKRYNYQVGVASVEEFTKNAFEFAANIKISLISLRWFLSERVCNLFTNINQAYLDEIPHALRNQLYSFLKNKANNSWNDATYSDVISFITTDNIIGDIIQHFNIVIQKSYVGLIETGDLIFLFANQIDSFELVNANINFNQFKARIHWKSENLGVWELELINNNEVIEINPKFKFHVPDRIMRQWQEFSLDKNVAINLKEQYFSRIFIFKGSQSQNELPFFLVNIDEPWLSNLNEQI